MSDRQEESDRSNQGVASPDYAETLITFHASSNHHILSALQKEEQVRIIPPDDNKILLLIRYSVEKIPL